MKKTILLICVLASIGTMKAQEGHTSFVVEGKTWRFNMYWNYSISFNNPNTWKESKGTYHYILKGDTVIGTRQCKKLYRIFDDEYCPSIFYTQQKPPQVGEACYVASLYEDGSRVNAIYGKDEFVLFDKNWNVGDKCYRLAGISAGTNWINRIGVMQGRDCNLKTVYMNACRYESKKDYHMKSVNYSTFVEKVGCLEDLFYLYKTGNSHVMKCVSCIDNGEELLPDMDEFYTDNYKLMQEDQDVYNRCGVGLHTVEIDGINYTVDNYMDGGVAVAPLALGKYKGDIYIPDSITYNGNRFAVKVIAASAMDSCDEVTSVRLPQNLFCIYYQAFRGCTGVKEWNLPDSLYSVYGGALAGCKGNMTVNSYLYSTATNSADYYHKYVNVGPIFKDATFSKMTFTTQAETISSSIFAQCNVETIVLKGEKLLINSKAFYELTRLSDVYDYATIPQSIDEQTFSVYNTLHVLPGSVELYQNAVGWRNFNIVGDLDVTGINNVKSNADLTPKGYYDLQGREVSRPEKGKIYIHDGKKVLVK